jgi:hypothetical protein
MYGYSIGASTLGLGEFTESNEPVCGDVMSGLRGNGLPVVRCLQNMALLIMIKLYNGLWVSQENLPSYKHITLNKNSKSSEIAQTCYSEHLYIQSGMDNCDSNNYWFHF